RAALKRRRAVQGGPSITRTIGDGSKRTDTATGSTPRDGPDASREGSLRIELRDGRLRIRKRQATPIGGEMTTVGISSPAVSTDLRRSSITLPRTATSTRAGTRRSKINGHGRFEPDGQSK